MLPPRRRLIRWDLAFWFLLEQLTQPALLTSSSGELISANAAGLDRLRAFPELISELQRNDPLTATKAGLRRIEGQDRAAGFHLWLEPPPSTSEETVERAAQRWKLTRRQRQVVALLLEGMSNEEMAAELRCSRRTVEVHLSAVLQKGAKETRGALVAELWRIAFGECVPNGRAGRRASRGVEVFAGL